MKNNRTKNVEFAPLKKFTLIELLLVITVIIILMSILTPALQKAKGLAAKTQCAGNLKNVGIATFQYAEDNGGIMHAAYNTATNVKWYRALMNGGYMTEPAPGKANVLQCPVNTSGWEENYTYGMLWPRYSSSGIWCNIYNVKKNYTWGHDNLTISNSAYPLYSDSIITPLNKQWYRIFIFNTSDSASGSIYLKHLSAANLWFCDGHVDSLNDNRLYEAGVEYLLK